MFITYILQSERSGRFYIGHTADMGTRLKKHNSGGVVATRNKGPWKIAYQEFFKTKIEANRRELHIKSMKSRLYIERLLSGTDRHVPT